MGGTFCLVDMVLKGGLNIMKILLSDTKRGSTLGPDEQIRPSSFRKQRRHMWLHDLLGEIADDSYACLTCL